jgi:hypothetical protein
MSMPVSYVLAKQEGREPPHLDYLVGTSSHTSIMKEAVIAFLKTQGSIWMKDCPQCLKDGTYQRVLDREKQQAIFEAEMIIKGYE